MVQDVTAQWIAAIETERVDTLLISMEPLAVLECEIRERLDASGYREIPMVTDVSSGIAMACAMLSAELLPAQRAYAGSGLRANPEDW